MTLSVTQQNNCIKGQILYMLYCIIKGPVTVK